MSPSLVTLLTGLVLLAFGGHFLWHGSRTEKTARAFPRSQAAAYFLFSGAAAWFLYKVTQLGPADFGQYKNYLFAFFLVTAVGSFYLVPDFLAVRGLAALILLAGDALLNATYMNFEAPALMLKIFVYVMIVIAIVLGASPYKLRDFFEWLYRSQARPRAFGGVFAIYGILLINASFTYANA